MKKNKLIYIALFAMYGALMFAGQFIMEFMPNIHPVTLFIISLTAVYGLRALIPIYIYVFIEGLFGGFGLWWLPYLYIWATQCLVALPVTKFFRGKGAYVAYPVLGALFGISYGIMYAPAQALLFGFDFDTALKWVVTGIPYDVFHCAGNFVMCLLAAPLAETIRKLHKATGIQV